MAEEDIYRLIERLEGSGLVYALVFILEEETYGSGSYGCVHSSAKDNKDLSVLSDIIKSVSNEGKTSKEAIKELIDSADLVGGHTEGYE